MLELFILGNSGKEYEMWNKILSLKNKRPFCTHFYGNLVQKGPKFHKKGEKSGTLILFS